MKERSTVSKRDSLGQVWLYNLVLLLVLVIISSNKTSLTHKLYFLSDPKNKDYH